MKKKQVIFRLDTTKLPKTMAHMQRMEARPAVKTVLDTHFG